MLVESNIVHHLVARPSGDRRPILKSSVFPHVKKQKQNTPMDLHHQSANTRGFSQDACVSEGDYSEGKFKEVDLSSLFTHRLFLFYTSIQHLVVKTSWSALSNCPFLLSALYRISSCKFQTCLTFIFRCQADSDPVCKPLTLQDHLGR